MNVIQFVSEKTSTKSSDSKFRCIMKLYKARRSKFDEKSNVQKEVMVLKYNQGKDETLA